MEKKYETRIVECERFGGVHKNIEYKLIKKDTWFNRLFPSKWEKIKNVHTSISLTRSNSYTSFTYSCLQWKALEIVDEIHRLGVERVENYLRTSY